MNSHAGVFAAPLPYEPTRDQVSVSEAVAPNVAPGHFADEQIRSLVRQVFVPGWPRPVRQAIFSSIDPDDQLGELCKRVGRELSKQISGGVCIVEMARQSAEDSDGGTAIPVVVGSYCPGEIKQSSRQIESNLWFTPNEVFLKGSCGVSSVLWLRTRLAQVRLDFEYAILQARPSGFESDVALAGSLTGGVILVIRADATRRMAAQKTKELLRAANALLLGTVLSNRRFPIPELLYRRL